MSVVVSGVEKGSAAEQAGFAAGDVLARIDGHDIGDVLDYRFYMTSSRLTAEGTTDKGAAFTRIVRKEEYDDLGLLFDTYLMDKQRPCRNKCVFCFIDQLPKGLRESLYFKDDDSRMSFLFGNYITLTNLEERDVERILAMHISPVNVSVHTMNPELRVHMMKNPHAGKVLEYIPRLARGGIKLNAQLVLCPGINDGPELRRSLDELCALAPEIQSVAVVPVGLTRYRERLTSLRLYTAEEARAVVTTLEEYGGRMIATHGSRICYAADEFYIAAGWEFPSAAHYGDFDQLENGVGLVALLRDEFKTALELEEPCPVERSVSISTGIAAAPFLRELADSAMARFPGLSVEVYPIANDFFGHDITVAGLITGCDIIRQLYGKELNDELLIPAVMLRREGDLFLDGTEIGELAKQLGVTVRAVANGGFELLDALLGRNS